MTLSQPTPVCDRCGRRRGRGDACQSCAALTLPDGQSVLLATRWRRLGGYFLDELLFLVTLGLGWLIWMHFTAKTAQTPAKRFLSMYVIMTNQRGPASYGRLWVREGVIEWALIGVVGGLFTGGIIGVIDALWIFLDRNKQTLHDKIAETLVVHAPEGIRSLDGSGATAVGRQPPLTPSPRPGTLSAPGGPESYGSSDTRERLRVLRTLWENGEISIGEYEKRRRRILDEI